MPHHLYIPNSETVVNIALVRVKLGFLNKASNMVDWIHCHSKLMLSDFITEWRNNRV